VEFRKRRRRQHAAFGKAREHAHAVDCLFDAVTQFHCRLLIADKIYP